MTSNHQRFSWWARASNADLRWATGLRGRYVIERINGGHWNVDHRRGPQGRKRRQLGTAATVAEARAIAERDYDLIRGAEARR